MRLPPRERPFQACHNGERTMTKKQTTPEKVIAAFAAAYPGNKLPEMAQWIANWRACYPQFEDIIFDRASAILAADANRPAVRTAVDEVAGTTIARPDELEAVRLQFVGLDDPTPEDLAAYKADHPEMAKDLEALACEMSRAAYLRFPVPPRSAQ